MHKLWLNYTKLNQKQWLPITQIHSQNFLGVVYIYYIIILFYIYSHLILFERKYLLNRIISQISFFFYLRRFFFFLTTIMVGRWRLVMDCWLWLKWCLLVRWWWQYWLSLSLLILWLLRLSVHVISLLFHRGRLRWHLSRWYWRSTCFILLNWLWLEFLYMLNIIKNSSNSQK